MSKPDFEAKLAVYCSRLFGQPLALSGLRRLSGGANMESWAFDYGARELVLRRMPGAGEGEKQVPRISIESEARLIALAGEHGVIAPAMLGILAPTDGLGEGFLMARIGGETMPHKILGNPQFAAAEQALARQCAQELAKIHALPIAALPDDLPEADAAALLADTRRRYDDHGARIPVFEFAFRWLADTLPAPSELSPLHGDFRMGNLMIGEEGITAILDWELAHIGDPAQDLAYLCTPSWRFTRHEKPVGGFAEIDDLLAAYETASGTTVNRKRFRWWLVYSTLWWGIVCLDMAGIWRTGADRSLERAVIGKRVSEVEVDLLLLFSPLLDDAAARKIAWQLPSIPSFTGEMHDAELLEALMDWDSDFVVPNAEGHDLFQARVARNAIGMLHRQATLGGDFAIREARRLDGLGLTPDQLCEGLASGELSPETPELLAHLRLTALERLSIHQPKYPGLATALDKWTSA